MSKPLIFLAAAALAAPAPVLAQAAGTATPMTRAGLSSDLEARFKSVDKNGDKVADKAEIEAFNARAAQQAEAILSKRLEAEFASLDTNKDKQLSLAEFKAAAPDAKATPAATTIQQFDTNKDQKVSLQEYGADMLAAFDRIDTDKNGTLSAEEQQAARQRR